MTKTDVTVLFNNLILDVTCCLCCHILSVMQTKPGTVWKGRHKSMDPSGGWGWSVGAILEAGYHGCITFLF